MGGKGPKTVFATILAVMRWCVDSAAALKYNGYRLESPLGGNFDKDSVHWRGPWYVNV